MKRIWILGGMILLFMALIKPLPSFSDVVTLNGRTYDSNSFKGYGYASIFPTPLLPDMLAEISHHLYTWRDDYNPFTAYGVADVVKYYGAVYVCKVAGTGNPPTDTSHWSLMVQNGVDGARGSVWYSGTDLPTISIGASGDFYLRYTTGDIFTKTGNSWGATITNIMGLPGVPGTDGTTWYSGTVTPSAGTGISGDFYLRTDTGDVYHKVGSSWGSPILNLKGQTGASAQSFACNLGYHASAYDSNTGVTSCTADATTGGGTDTNALHVGTSGEIATVISKSTPTTSDLMLIEDSAATNSKKKITAGSLPISTATQAALDSKQNTLTAGVDYATPAAVNLKAPIASPVHTGSVTADGYISTAPNGQHMVGFANTTSVGYQGPRTRGIIFHNISTINYCETDNVCKRIGSGNAQTVLTLLSALTDTNILTPATNDFLRYVGTKWVNDPTVTVKLSNYSAAQVQNTAKFNNMSSQFATVRQAVISAGIDIVPPTLTRLSPATQVSASTTNSLFVNYSTADNVGMASSHSLQYSQAGGTWTDFVKKVGATLSGFTANTPTTVAIKATDVNNNSYTENLTFTYETAVLGFSPSSKNYGTVDNGTTSASQTFTLSNTGLAQATGIGTFSISGTDAAMFALSGNTCGTTLNAGANCTMGVTFTPSSAGSKTASLGNGTYSASLSGTGQAVVINPDYSWALTDNVASTTVVESVHGANGTLNGVNTSAIHNGTDNALAMNTNQYFYAPAGPATDAGAFTVQFDIKYIGNTFGSTSPFKSHSSSINCYFINATTLKNYYNSSATNSGNITIPDITTTQTWYTIRYVYDGSTFKTYFGTDENNLVLKKTDTVTLSNYDYNLSNATTFTGWGGTTAGTGNLMRNIKMWQQAVNP